MAACELADIVSKVSQTFQDRMLVTLLPLYPRKVNLLRIDGVDLETIVVNASYLAEKGLINSGIRTENVGHLKDLGSSLTAEGVDKAMVIVERAKATRMRNETGKVYGNAPETSLTELLFKSIGDGAS